MTHSGSDKQQFDGVITPIEEGDLEGVRPILERWIFDRETGLALPGEVDDSLLGMSMSIEGQLDRQYVVAKNRNSRVVGVMGLIAATPYMIEFATGTTPGELINADVADDQRGRGVGRALVKHLENIAYEKGYDEIVVNSGPRYRDTGWPFWNAVYGQPVGVAKDLYGPSGDAMVWRSGPLK